MKIAFISTYYRESELEDIEKVKKQIKALRLKKCTFYISDCTRNNKGYAAGVNSGIKKALKDHADILVIFNPDISIKGISAERLIAPSMKFDVWGFANKQQGIIYYGGEIDRLRMSAGLITKKPQQRFQRVDFVSGSFLLIKRAVVEKTGLWNESYFLYYEEVDYCFRARQAGFSIGIDSETTYEHFEVSNQQNPRKDFYLAKSRFKFLLRFGTTSQKIYELMRSPKTLFEYKGLIISYIFSSQFLMNFFSLNISSFLIKVTNFINFLVLIHYLTAPEYGIYTLVWAQVMLLSPLADLGTTSYGVVYLPNKDEKSMHSLLNLRIFTAVIIFAATVFFTLFIFKGNIKLYGYIFITATVIFTNMFSGSYFILTAVKNQVYKSSRNALIFNISLAVAIAVSLIMTKRLLAVFMVIFALYNLYTLFNMVIVKREIKKFVLDVNPKFWLEILKKSYIFILISFFAGMYFKLDVFVLGFFKGEEAVGIYSAGYKFFEALIFIASSYTVTATPMLARIAKNKYLLKRRLMKDMAFLISIGLLVASGVIVFAPHILGYILHKNYSLSIPVLQIIILSFPFLLLNTLCMNILYILEKAHYVVFVFLTETIINLLLNILLIPHFSYYASSVITVVSEMINFGILMVLTTMVWRRYRFLHEP